MRQFSPASNLILTCCAALGLLATLALPWFAPAVPDDNPTNGPVERAAGSVGNVFRHHDGAVSGRDVVGGAGTLLYVLAAIVFVLALVASVPAARAYARDVLRAVAIATPVIVAYLAIDRPGNVGDGMNVHWGLPVTFLVALLMASTAWWGSEIRLKRPEPGSWARAGTR